MLVGVINIVAILTYVYMYVHVYVYMTIDTPFSVCAMLLWYEECCKSVFLLVWGRSMQSKMKLKSTYMFYPSTDSCLFAQHGYHGFPLSPSAMTFDPYRRLLYIGTSSGDLRM